LRIHSLVQFRLDGCNSRLQGSNTHCRIYEHAIANATEHIGYQRQQLAGEGCPAQFGIDLPWQQAGCAPAPEKESRRQPQVESLSSATITGLQKSRHIFRSLCLHSTPNASCVETSISFKFLFLFDHRDFFVIGVREIGTIRVPLQVTYKKGHHNLINTYVTVPLYHSISLLCEQTNKRINATLVLVLEATETVKD